MTDDDPSGPLTKSMVHLLRRWVLGVGFLHDDNDDDDDDNDDDDDDDNDDDDYDDDPMSYAVCPKS